MSPAYWYILDPTFPPDGLGHLPEILLPQEQDARPIKEQLAERYAHGGGYNPIEGTTFDRMTGILSFPGDPPYKPSAMFRHGYETVIFYRQGELLAIIQLDGSYEVTRVN